MNCNNRNKIKKKKKIIKIAWVIDWRTDLIKLKDGKRQADFRKINSGSISGNLINEILRV